MIDHGRMVKTGRIYISKSLELLEKQCPHKKNKGRCGTASRVWVLLGSNRWSQDVTLSSIVYKLYIKSGIYCCPELCAAELVFLSTNRDCLTSVSGAPQYGFTSQSLMKKKAVQNIWKWNEIIFLSFWSYSSWMYFWF